MTIASKARSGVKSPVLKGHGVRLRVVVVIVRERDRQKLSKEKKRIARKEKK